jgi:hypothetical protein
MGNLELDLLFNFSGHTDTQKCAALKILSNRLLTVESKAGFWGMIADHVEHFAQILSTRRVAQAIS